LFIIRARRRYRDQDQQNTLACTVRSLLVEQNRNIVNKDIAWRRKMTEWPVPKWRQKMLDAEAKRQEQPRCVSCGQPENIIWVHGHGQCAYCKVNVQPCCSGETC
jgi:hypothetical protein